MKTITAQAFEDMDRLNVFVKDHLDKDDVINITIDNYHSRSFILFYWY